MNIRNPQPDTHYFYQLNKPGPILNKLNQGYTIVTRHDPEQWGADLGMEHDTGVDTVKAYQDVVLMKCPMDTYRKIREERQRDAEVARSGAEEEFFSKSARVQGALGSYTEGRDIYYQRPQHTTASGEALRAREEK
jgi:hypothetical protein